MSNNKSIKKLFNNYELNKGITGVAGWFFIISIFLTIFLFIMNIVALYDSPHTIEKFEADENIFLGFYEVNSSSKILSLSWCSYLVGILTIVLVICNCFLYYMVISSSLTPFVNLRLLMINLICGVVICTLLFILNIFNKPNIDVHTLDILTNGWNPDPSKHNSTIQFNYVYDISFISDGTKTLTSHKHLNNFNIIWIVAMTAFELVYIISLFMFLNYKQVKLTPILRKVKYE